MKNQLITYDSFGINTDSSEFTDFCELANLKGDANQIVFFDIMFSHLTEIFILDEETTEVNKTLYELFKKANKSILNSFRIVTCSESLNLFYAFMQLRIVGNYSDEFNCPYCFRQMDVMPMNETADRAEFDVRCEICGFEDLEVIEKD